MLEVPDSKLVVSPVGSSDVDAFRSAAELVMPAVVLVVCATNCAASSSEEPSTADRLPTTPTLMLSSPSAAASSDRKGELPPRVDSPTAAEPTLASSEDMPTSSMIAPVVSASRRPDSPPTTEMEIAPAGSSDALATARARESSEDKSNPRVRPSSLSVCLRPTTCNVQSFTGRKEPCKYGGGPVCCRDVRYCRQPSAELNRHDWILKDGATAQSPFLQSR
mmetsp:Transcript_114487/g.272380  ORF Transcript_114487/g.272380 Transcript_114487/m.272380 type:complete len:221 (-) Transcript_114487:2458-3120(-)